MQKCFSFFKLSSESAVHVETCGQLNVTSRHGCIYFLLKHGYSSDNYSVTYVLNQVLAGCLDGRSWQTEDINDPQMFISAQLFSDDVVQVRVQQ